LVRGDNALTADTAMRFAKVFGTTPEYWMNLQRAWDLARAQERIDVSDIEPLAAA
jgi:addiction module HigA family antidote